jgi:hypothetical protein
MLMWQQISYLYCLGNRLFRINWNNLLEGGLKRMHGECSNGSVTYSGCELPTLHLLFPALVSTFLNECHGYSYVQIVI